MGLGRFSAAPAVWNGTSDDPRAMIKDSCRSPCFAMRYIMSVAEAKPRCAYRPPMRGLTSFRRFWARKTDKTAGRKFIPPPRLTASTQKSHDSFQGIGEGVGVAVNFPAFPRVPRPSQERGNFPLVGNLEAALIISVAQENSCYPAPLLELRGLQVRAVAYQQ
jgi:hypothetical protein